MKDTPQAFEVPDRFMEIIPHMKEVGMTIELRQGYDIQLLLPFREEWIGDSVHGLIHPGVITMLVDSCGGIAVMARLGKLEAIATLDLRMDYLWPAVKDQPLHCRGSCYRLSSNIAFVRADVWQDDAQKIIATSQAVFMRSARGKERNYE